VFGNPVDEVESVDWVDWFFTCIDHFARLNWSQGLAAIPCNCSPHLLDSGAPTRRLPGRRLASLRTGHLLDVAARYYVLKISIFNFTCIQCRWANCTL